MVRSSYSTRFAVLAMAIASQGSAATPPMDEREVLKLLHGIEFKESRQKLIAWGTEAFPIYLSILEDKRATGEEIGRILGVLYAVEADRSRFLEVTIAALAHADGYVRWPAVKLLAQIGSQKDAAPVVALLSDGNKPADKVVAFSTAETLVAIGGPREVVAMDAWLLGASHANDKELRAHVKKCRDELAARLAKDKPKK